MFDVVILSGGIGSRSANPAIPKSLQTINGSQTVVERLSDTLEGSPVRSIVGVFGENPKMQQEHFENIKWPGKFQVTNSTNKGTSHAVVTGAKLATEKYCLVVMGDTAASIPFGDFYEIAKVKDSDILFICRHSDHPQDSDGVIFDDFGRITNFIPKGSERYSRGAGPKKSLSGALFVKTEILSAIQPSGDFQSALFQYAREKKLIVHGVVSRYFLRDTGTSERLESVREAFRDGGAFRRGRQNVGAIFLDRDGTIMPDAGDDRTNVQSFEIIPEVANQIRSANKYGIPIFLVTNQPGIAKGKIRFEDVAGTHFDVQEILGGHGAFFDDYRFCPHHPEQGWKGEVVELKQRCKCRKPNIGMLQDLASAHSISLEHSWVIGDSAADSEMARVAGARIVKVNTNDFIEVAQGIRKAVKEICNAYK